MNKSKVVLIVFILVSLLDMVGILFEIPVLIQIFKPLILVSLILLYITSAVSINKLYVLALICSFFGDVFLMYKGEKYFIIGLISFLIAHLIFIKIVTIKLQKTTISKIITSIIPFLLLFIGLIYFLKDNLSELLIPVIIYGLTISTFGVLAMLNYLITKNNISLLMFLGAVIFISSDSILAINKFYYSTKIMEVLIMATYIAAQFLIYKSMTKTESLKVC
jgi:uncharacterized membrane protein YhhN